MGWFVVVLRLLCVPPVAYWHRADDSKQNAVKYEVRVQRGWCGCLEACRLPNNDNWRLRLGWSPRWSFAELRQTEDANALGLPRERDYHTVAWGSDAACGGA